MRRFSSYGPVDPQEHFCVPRTALIEQCASQLVGNPDKHGHYFTIWAPRQTGKTWLMRRAMEQVRARYGERFIVGALSMQSVQLKDDDPPEAFFPWVQSLFSWGMETQVPEVRSWTDWVSLFRKSSTPFARPLILLIDEFDKLPPQLLSQLVGTFRDLFLTRETSVLHGLALVGVRAVLGVDSERGSPFNIQRSLHVPNLTQAEVEDLYGQYARESGQAVEPEVVQQVFDNTRGHPGLCSWFGELLTEKYNPGPPAPITRATWDAVHLAACRIEHSNTILNLLKKAQRKYRRHVLRLFSQASVPFAFGRPWCSYLYLNGIIDYQAAQGVDGKTEYLCRFASPFVQLRLYTDLSADSGRRDPMGESLLDPRDDLHDVLTPQGLNVPALLGRYRDYLQRLHKRGINPFAGQPRRQDLHLTEAVGHFHLYWWLREVIGRQCVISPEFPTGNGKVDLHLSYLGHPGLIEVKSFTFRHEIAEQRLQAARYAGQKGLSASALALFVPTQDEEIMQELAGAQEIQGVTVTTVPIGQP